MNWHALEAAVGATLGLLSIVEGFRVRQAESVGTSAGPTAYMVTVGCAMVAVGAFLMVLALRKGDAVRHRGVVQENPRGYARRAFMLSCVSLLGYTLATQFLGYNVATFLFLLLFIKYVSQYQWWVAGVVAVATVVAMALVFPRLAIVVPTGLWW